MARRSFGSFEPPGLPRKKGVRLLQALYKISTSALRIAEWSRTLIGVMQGFISSPQLFNILLDFFISLAIQNLSTCIGINLQGMTINNLQFADDIILMADSVKDLQRLVKNVHIVSWQFGLMIN